MEKARIIAEMKALESKLGHQFKDLDGLSKAMYARKMDKTPGQGKNASEYENEGLATVGDAVLKAIITDHLYRSGITTKGKITEEKSKIENNEVMHDLMIGEGWIDYSYNELHFYKDKDIPDHERVVCKEHDPYVEAIVGAVYYDSDYDTTQKWIEGVLLPLLKKYAKDA